MRWSARSVTKHAVRRRIEDDSVHVFENARPHIVRRIRRLAEGHQKFAVFIEFHDARIAVAVCDEHRPVGKPVDEGRPVEVLFVVARLIGRAEGLYQLLAIVREFVNRMALVVNHPNVFIRVIRVNGDVVRALEHGIPFGPVFDQIAVRVHDYDAMLPPRVHAKLPFPHGIARGSNRPNRGVTKRKLGNRKGDAGANFGVGNFFGALHRGNFAALQDENAIGALREDALHRSPGPLFVSRAGK